MKLRQARVTLEVNFGGLLSPFFSTRVEVANECRAIDGKKRKDLVASKMVNDGFMKKHLWVYLLGAELQRTDRADQTQARWALVITYTCSLFQAIS
jgi:hypothetical protein